MCPWNLDHYDAFFLDVDGVLVHDGHPLEGVAETLEMLQQAGQVLILTNNSTRSRQQHAQNLSSLGLNIQPDNVICSSDVAAEYLRVTSGSTQVWPIGEEGLSRELLASGHELVDVPSAAEWVVVGMDRAITYKKLADGLHALANGARLLATNEDSTYPTPDALMPGAGAVVGAFRGMGYAPAVTVGKPERYLYEMALKQLGRPDANILMIGDRLGTDILGANRLGIDSLLVLSGIAQRTEIETSGIAPTWIAESISSLLSNDVYSH